MAELDYLLVRFLDQHYQELTPRQQRAFERLLEVEDDRLWAWLNDQAQASDPELAGLVRDIRTAR